MNLDLIKLCCRACEAAYSDQPAAIPYTLWGEAFRHGNVHWHIYGLPDRELLVAFRGTDDIRGWVSDFTAYPVKYPGYEGLVHLGFAEDLERAWQHVLLSLSGRDCHTAVYTGHSLGAARATLAVQRGGNWFDAADLITFGSPRVGEWHFAASIARLAPHTRVVHEHDLVCHAPPPPLFWHVGKSLYLHDDGRLVPEVPDPRHLLEELVDDVHLTPLDHPIAKYCAALDRAAILPAAA